MIKQNFSKVKNLNLVSSNLLHNMIFEFIKIEIILLITFLILINNFELFCYYVQFKIN